MLPAAQRAAMRLAVVAVPVVRSRPYPTSRTRPRASSALSAARDAV